MRTGLFNVNVLARLASHDGCRGVPMVGRGDDDGINIFLFHQPADITQPLRVFAGAFADIRNRAVNYLAVHIADISNLDIWNSAEILREVKAPAVRAHHTDDDLFIRRPLKKTGGFTQ